ncbi:Vacuolar protein sorting-associated protein [Echinococcus granulosus]|uniref:Vacuolar protein sorting-associated protein 16 homolog n=1 Tax=Echinococcus granulosus TaxID=6210 RepID=W6V090_ECHGR|nr:Vacuolar protein sorting-associated protein [Echinococcus granulosus]EUB64267.1 Vacuolar protein sorting-associated protein [Echinococcus granulosus]
MIGTPLGQIIIESARRLILYKLDLTESQNFNDFFIAVGGCGGLTAFLQKPKQTGNSVLIITTAAGKVFAENLWKDAPPVAVTWSDSEELAVVQKSGYVTMLNLNGTFKRRFGFGKEAENTQIVEAKFFSFEGRTAVAVITGSSQIFVASSLERPRILAISTEVPLTNRAFVWQLVSSSTSGEIGAFKGPWVLLAVDKEIHRMGVGKAMKVEIQSQGRQNRFSAYHKMAISPDEERVALYLDSGLLRVASLGPSFEVCMELDFSDRAAALGSGSNGGHVATLPSDMAWFDNSTIALQWRNFLVIADMEKNVYELFYPSFVHIQPEASQMYFFITWWVDGLRVLTPATHEIIQRVPQELECLGRIGASSPAVLLLSAYREWEAGSGRAHEFLRPIHSAGRMHDAVSACLRSAAQCAPSSALDVQRTLLAAAHFGRGFLSILAAPGSGAKDLDCGTLDNLSELTIQITTTLRLLNSIAVDWIGMALTWKQFELLGPSTLLNRLLARKHYPLAVELVRVYQKFPSKIPEYVQVRTTGMTRILRHWVKSLPAQSANPSDTSNSMLTRRLFEIINRCGGSDRSADGGGVSFAAVAETAIECGQLALAERLLELEPRISAQIALLMRLRRYGHALTRAVQSGDADLLLAGVLQPLQEGEARMEPTALSLLLRQHPIALALYRQYLEGAGVGGSIVPRQPRGKLASQTLAVLQQEDDPALAIQRTVLEAFSSKDPVYRSSLLLKARDSYQQIKADFLSHTCEEAAKLINFHRRLEEQQVTAPYFCLDDRAPGSHVLPRVLEAAAFRWQGASVNATYTRLVAAGSQLTERLADQLRRDFKMPEKRVAYLRLIGLALSANTDAAWTEIERMAFAKRPLIQLDVFVKIYVDAGRLQQAADIIEKLPLEQRIRSLILIGQSQEAIDLAIHERSESMLHLIQRLLIKTDRATADQVGRIRSQLSSDEPELVMSRYTLHTAYDARVALVRERGRSKSWCAMAVVEPQQKVPSDIS